MLDVKFIKENRDIVQDSIEKRGLSKKVDLEKLLDLDSKHKELLRNIEEHRSLRNKLSKDISKVSEDERKKLVDEATKVKNELKEMEVELETLSQQVKQTLLNVPNVLSHEVPEGKMIQKIRFYERGENPLSLISHLKIMSISVNPWILLILTCWESKVAPHGNVCPCNPLAAISHSSAVGSRFPAHWAYA